MAQWRVADPIALVRMVVAGAHTARADRRCWDVGSHRGCRWCLESAGTHSVGPIVERWREHCGVLGLVSGLPCGRLAVCVADAPAPPALRPLRARTHVQL